MDLTLILGILLAKGWPTAWALMNRWFTNSPKIKTDYAPPDTTNIHMDWALRFERAREVFDKLVKEREWITNPAAQWEIIKMLDRKGLFTGKRESFGNLDGPVPAQDPDHIIDRSVGDLWSEVDEMYAALGNFLMRVLVQGTVEPYRPPSSKNPTDMLSTIRVQYLVKIEKVGIYIYDTYDFEGGYFGIDQFLGFWNPSNNSVSSTPIHGGTAVWNSDFRDWRAKHGRGGDFQIYSDIKQIPRPPDTFIVREIPKHV